MLLRPTRDAGGCEQFTQPITTAAGSCADDVVAHRSAVHLYRFFTAPGPAYPARPPPDGGGAGRTVPGPAPAALRSGRLRGGTRPWVLSCVPFQAAKPSTR